MPPPWVAQRSTRIHDEDSIISALRKPKPVRRGDLVAVVAPSGACDPERLSAGVRLLEGWGLRVHLEEPGPALRYFAAGDRERAGRLTDALRRTDVKAVLATRGGYGSARLHPYLDVADALPDPKIFVGFSDLTILLSRIVQEAHVVAYHGPMVAADLPQFDDSARERFRRFLFGEPDWWEGCCPEVWRGGTAEARLVGGCLSVLVTTLGTPYEIDTDGAILFLEDVAEKPYRIDRMLTHLKHAGKLSRVRGVVLGSMLDCDGGEGEGVLRDVVTEVIEDSAVPVLAGFDAGHGTGNVVLPFGCQVRLDAGTQQLTLLEPVFS